jgi:streptogramin lyase
LKIADQQWEGIFSAEIHGMEIVKNRTILRNVHLPVYPGVSGGSGNEATICSRNVAGIHLESRLPDILVSSAQEETVFSLHLQLSVRDEEVVDEEGFLVSIPSNNRCPAGDEVESAREPGTLLFSDRIESSPFKWFSMRFVFTKVGLQRSPFRLPALLLVLLAMGTVPAMTLLPGAELQYPIAVATAASGDIYIADRQLPGIWRLRDGKAEIYYQAKKRFGTPLNAIRCLAIDANGKLLAGDSATRDVYRFNAEGDEPTPLTAGGIGIPMGIAVDADGNLLVTDLELHCVWKVPGEGGKPEKLAMVNAPTGITIDTDGRAWIVSRGVDAVQRLAADGSLEKVVTGRPFRMPHDIVLDGKGAAFITDGLGKAIWHVVEGAEPRKLVDGDPLMNPVGISWQGDKLIVADPHARSIFSVDSEGQVTPLVSPEK